MYVAAQRACVLKIKERYVLLDLLGFRFFMGSARTQELMHLLHQGTTLHQVISQLKRKYLVDQILAEIAQLLALHILAGESEKSLQI